jgi:putative phosphoesterase
MQLRDTADCAYGCNLRQSWDRKTIRRKKYQDQENVMKIMIASDIHGSAYYCRKMVAAFERERAQRLLLLGDILYHGPRNDLPREYAPKEVTSMLNARKDQIYCVRGNCDTEVDQMVLEFPIMADYGILSVSNRVIYVTHGHVYHRGNLPPLQPGDLLLHGHTHVPAWESFGEGNLYLNPGSVSIPKGNSAHSYLTLHDGVFQWKDLDGDIFHQLTMTRSDPSSGGL